MHGFPDLPISFLPHTVDLVAHIELARAAAGGDASDVSNPTNCLKPPLTSLGALAIEALNLQLNKPAYDLRNASTLAPGDLGQSFVLTGFE
jgi:hypothetical protein